MWPAPGGAALFCVDVLWEVAGAGCARGDMGTVQLQISRDFGQLDRVFVFYASKRGRGINLDSKQPLEAQVMTQTLKQGLSAPGAPSPPSPLSPSLFLPFSSFPLPLPLLQSSHQALYTQQQTDTAWATVWPAGRDMPVGGCKHHPALCRYSAGLLPLCLPSTEPARSGTCWWVRGSKACT